MSTLPTAINIVCVTPHLRLSALGGRGKTETSVYALWTGSDGSLHTVANSVAFHLQIS